MNDHFEIINKIADEILKDKDNAKAIEFTKVIGTLLRENCVTPICTEYVADGCFDNKLGFGYKCCFEKLDFSEHDKVFEDKIAKLEKQIKSYEAERKELRTRCCMDSAREKFDNHSYGGLVIYTKNFTSECERRLYDENKELKQRIAELEDKIGDRDEINRCLREQIAELQSKEKIELPELPFDPLDTANYLINATYERETNGIERVVQNLPEKVISDRYTVDELEQIAEHLLIYCRHNKE